MASATSKAFKIALIGTQRVGKTSLLSRFHFGKFDTNTIATVGASFLVHTFQSGSKEVPFQIWDTAGQERYRSLGPIYYRDSLCAISVFDLTSADSFEALKIYISQFRSNCSNYVHIAVVGNKLDLFRDQGGVDVSAIRKWATSEGFSFHLTSASTGEGVNEMFNEVAATVIERSVPTQPHGVDIEAKKDDQKCC